jgi:tryptophan synthase alpha chain
MNPIDELFRRLSAQRRKAFMPFLTAGDPDLSATGMALRELVGRGASLVELGFPYTDPIADGPVVQASYTRALDRGIRIDQVFSWTSGLVGAPWWKEHGVPLVGMVSYSLVHRRGPAEFVSGAQSAGFSGAIIPDLPIEEAAPLARLAADRDFKLIPLVTPTTPRDRARRIAEAASGFLYCVSVTGITGERDHLPTELLDQLHWLRKETSLPLCVGFGISKPKQVRLLRDAVDGVIVGSALVRLFEQADRRPVEQIVSEMGSLAQSLADALNPGR